MCAMTQQWNKCEKHVCEWQFHKAHSGNSSMAPREWKFNFFTRKIFIATGFVVVVVVIEKGPRERERCQHVREAKSDMNAHDTWTRGAFWTLSGIFTLNLKFFFCDFSPLETTFKSIGFANKNLLLTTMLLLVDDLEKLFDGVTDVFEEIKKVNVEFVFEVDLARLFFHLLTF